MFARRLIQQALDASRAYLSERQRARLVLLLNSEPEESIPAEWETMVLQAFARAGQVLYESKFTGPTKPDLLFSLKGESIPSFVADIATVSDRGLHDRNPVNDLREGFSEFARRAGISWGGFQIGVKGERVGKFGDSKMHLHLPPKKDLPSFIESEFGALIAAVRTDPRQPAHKEVTRPGIQVRVDYNPQDTRFNGGGHPMYTVPYSLTKNPIANVLVRKADQLVKSGYEGMHGVVLCDGGCYILWEDYRRNGSSTYSLEQIITRVFAKRPSLGFVLILVAEGAKRSYGQPRPAYVNSRLYTNAHCHLALDAAATEVLMGLHQHLPTPAQNAQNTFYKLRGKEPHQGLSMNGMWEIDGTEIRIPARALLELLAGKDHPHNSLGKLPNPHEPYPSETAYFLKRLKSGETISGVSLERIADKDDDWIVLRFDKPDAAIMPFV